MNDPSMTQGFLLLVLIGSGGSALLLFVAGVADLTDWIARKGWRGPKEESP